MPEMTMQHCTDETTDKEMSTPFSPMGKEICSKQDIQKTATGFVSDSVCSVGGVSMTRMPTSPATSIPPTPSSRRRTARAVRPACRATSRRRSRRNGSAPARPIRSPATS